jgi:acylphosphatase
MKVRAHIWVSGIVQGVDFRYFTFQEAREKNVSGWIRNTVDGGIEAVFEGEKEDVEKMIDFCSKGPLGSHVEGIEVKKEKFKGEFGDFEIAF